PVSAAVGRSDISASLTYGEASDTWSANPISCAAVLATLDEFESTGVLEHGRGLTPLFCEQLEDVKETGLRAEVRGEGMVFGIECAAAGSLTAGDAAYEIIRTCYLGEPGGDGVHLLGTLAGKVIRISPPLTITREEADDSLELLKRLVGRVAMRVHAPA